MRTIEVVAAVIHRSKRVFATQRGYGPYKDGWEFPGGKIEKGESPEAALKREIQEELDTCVEVGELLCTVEYDYWNESKPPGDLILHYLYDRPEERKF